MKKPSLMILMSAVLLSSIATSVAARPALAAEQTPPYGWNIVLSASSYEHGDAVDFCIENNSRIPFFYGPDEHPWVISDSNGHTVYQPNSVSPAEQPEPKFGKICDSWDQRTNSHTLVDAGSYQLSFRNTVFNVTPASFVITEKQTSHDLPAPSGTHDSRDEGDAHTEVRNDARNHDHLQRNTLIIGRHRFPQPRHASAPFSRRTYDAPTAYRGR